MTTAQGGQMGGPATQSVMFMSKMVVEELICNQGFGYLDNVTSNLEWYEGSIAILLGKVLKYMGKGISMGYDLIAGGSQPSIVYYVGAGIGGGHGTNGGEIHIENGAFVTAISGVLPTTIHPSFGSAAAFGRPRSICTNKNHSGSYDLKKFEVYEEAYAMVQELSLTGDITKPETLQTKLYDQLGPLSINSPTPLEPYHEDWTMKDRLLYSNVGIIMPESMLPKTVTFDKNAEDAEGTMAPQAISPGVATPLTKNAFTRGGYTFNGWNTAADGTGDSYADEQEVTLTDNLVLYAQWVPNKVTVTFMDYENSVYQTSQVNRGSTVELPVAPNGPGQFLGWTENPIRTGKGYGAGVTYPSPANSDMTFYPIFWSGSGTPTPEEPTVTAIVTYKPNGGEGDARVDSVTAPENTMRNGEYSIWNCQTSDGETAFTRTGYTLKNFWRVSGDATKTYTFGSKPFESGNIQTMTLLAQWQPNTYTVEFDKNAEDAVGTINDQTFTYDVEQNLTTNIASVDTNGSPTYTISREGYEFVGWNTVANPTEDNPGVTYPDSYPVKNLTDVNNGEVTLYAQWSKLPDPSENVTIYVVTFNENAPEARADGQSGAKDEIQLLYPGGSETMKLLSLEEIKEDVGGYEFPHYAFDGWNTEADGTGTPYTPGAKITSDDEIDGITLYAQWEANEYAVTFKNEGGAELQSGNVAYGETPEYTGETPTKEATAQYKYKFAGWDPEIVPVSGEATYTATYSEDLQEYPITFYDEDGTTEIATVDVAYGEIPGYDGEMEDKQDGDTIRKFTGWDPEPVAVTGPATYTATYTETPIEAEHGTLTFNLAGGTYNGSTEPLTIVANVGDVVKIPSAPVREGFVFIEWRGSSYQPGDEYTVEGDHTFTAVWGSTVTYNANGGEGAMDSQTVEEGAEVVLSANAFTRDGYTFTGWNTASDGSGTAYADGATVTPDGSITLYAQWEKNAASATKASSKSGKAVNTGDALPVVALALLAAAAAIALVVAALRRRKSL